MSADDFTDQELADSASVAVDLLRSIAERWRSRMRAGRLGQHPASETSALVDRLDAAIAALTSSSTTTASGTVGTAEPRESVKQRAVTEERFRQLVDNVRDYAIFMLDENGIVESWNAGAERINGYRPEEVLGKHFSILYPPEERASGKAQRELDTAAREGRYVEEGWRMRKSGERFFAHVTLTALRDCDGRLTGFAKVTRDVSELRKATEALRQSEERFRLMVEVVRDYAIFMLDPTGHIASWNVGAQRLKGYSADEIVGKHFSIFYPQEERDRGHPAFELERAIADGRYEEEGWRIKKDGTRFWANVVITAVFDQEHKHVGFTKVTRDFTEAKRLRDAQLAIQLRDDFLAIAGHELRTPLTALLMQLQSLTRSKQAALDPQRTQTRLEKAAASGARLEKLVAQMLEVSRITAGRLRLDIESVRLDELAHDVVERFAEMAAEARAPITLHASPVSGGWDRMRLEQVLTNLLSNAIKYGRGHPVEVEVREQGDDDALVRVTDRGIGIGPDDQKKLFQRFQRANGTREYGGFGLGLWISRQIVDASGGTIACASEPGRGSTFTVTLPKKPSAAVLAHNQPTTQSADAATAPVQNAGAHAEGVT